MYETRNGFDFQNVKPVSYLSAKIESIFLSYQQIDQISKKNHEAPD